ncbi:MAG: PhoU domain-containing protein [Candidatus Thorarchaeota archaeon]
MSINTRKLNKVRNSFYVYLPKEWIENHKLDEKSEVRIVQTPEATLEIFPPEHTKRESEVLKFNMEDVSKGRIEGILIGGYIVGANGMEFNFPNTIDMTTREMFSQWIRRLPGFEILDEHSQSLTVSDTSEKQLISPILRRQFATTKFMLDGLIRAIASAELESAQRILDRDEDVDRHRYFVERLCHLALQDPSYARKIGISPADCLHFSLATKYIERIADHVCGAMQQMIQIKSADPKPWKSLESLGNAYDETIRAFFSIESPKRRDSIAAISNDAFEALSLSKRVSARLSKLEASKHGQEPRIVLLLMHLERIASYCADIGEVAINRIIESSL